MSNEEINDIMKTVKALEDLEILLERITKTIKNETKEQKEGFLSTLLGSLASNLLGNMLAGREIVRAGYGNKQGKRIIRARYGSSIEKEEVLIPSHPQTNLL